MQLTTFCKFGIFWLLMWWPYTCLVQCSWEEWWTYEGISGPSFWGRLNPKWNLCSKGRKQSPIDIKPELLLYDPLLPPLTLMNDHINGHLINTGKGLVFRINSENSVPLSQFTNAANNKYAQHHHHISLSSGSSMTNQMHATHNYQNSKHSSSGLNSISSDSANSIGSSLSNVNSADVLEPVQIQFTSGPLTYAYTLSHLSLHYGRDELRGSEHTISGIQFPGELQFIAYNSQLYSNFEEAQNKVHGLVAVSVLIQLAEIGKKQQNQELKRLINALQNITAKGSIQRMDQLSIKSLLPKQHLATYCTYEGSVTQPACFETVQWLVLNKPIYLTSALFSQLRTALHFDEYSRSADNFRPVQKLNNRTIRTNIEFRAKPNQTHQSSESETHLTLADKTSDKMLTCSMRRPMYYREPPKGSPVTGALTLVSPRQNHGNYAFGYKIVDKLGAKQSRSEKGDPWTKYGHYSLHDVDGRQRYVSYVADKDGFRARIETNEPGTGSADAAHAIYNGPDAHGHSETHVSSGHRGHEVGTDQLDHQDEAYESSAPLPHHPSSLRHMNEY